MERIYDIRASGGRLKPAFWKLVRASAPKDDDAELDGCPDDALDVTVQLGVAQGGIDVDVSYLSHSIAACGYSVFLKTEQAARFLGRDAPEAFRTGSF